MKKTHRTLLQSILIGLAVFFIGWAIVKMLGVKDSGNVEFAIAGAGFAVRYVISLQEDIKKKAQEEEESIDKLLKQLIDLKQDNSQLREEVKQDSSQLREEIKRQWVLIEHLEGEKIIKILLEMMDLRDELINNIIVLPPETKEKIVEQLDSEDFIKTLFRSKL